MPFTNTSNVSLALATWLVDDDYDYINKDNYISVTTLMRPLRQIVLSSRDNPLKRPTDVSDMVSTALGKTIHAGIEKAWNNPQNLKKLGIPDHVVARVVVNPTSEEVLANPDMIPVYLEQREFRVFNGFTIGGKFDFLLDGQLEDFKSTSAFTFVYGSRDEEHILQGSLYRWLDAARKNPRITEPNLRINYVFTDFSKVMASRVANYPKSRIMDKEYPLTSLRETEQWVKAKTDLIRKHKDTPERDLPKCTPEELWMSDSKFKYFSDPEKAKDPSARSTKNFDNAADANAFLQEKKKGVVVEVKGEPKRCLYCPVFDLCSQKDEYFEKT